MADEFGAALTALDRAGNPPQAFCDVVADTFPVTGAAVSTLGDVLGSETLAATDATAARLDELQFDLGEGPCWDAVTTGIPVLQPDIRRFGGNRWPTLVSALATEPVASIFAFPLVVGPLRFGAIDLYSNEPVTLDATSASRVSAMAEVVSRRVLQRALENLGLQTEDGGNAFSRRLIHQATGMVLAQIGVTAEDARLVIQGHAFSQGRPMMEIAQAIISGDLRFSRLNGRIEVDE
ncbi:GAF and ANTAR domain-containing protein [Microbacterium pygmaeum]|uniref:ANTAR domain-containing protein n=1 Tax=Microbacterium pygmaeum TaxID=370764 RepID=A0A1G7YK87_9MICO|nr:GAF and ANTAR domain-containing protein [Microbacterium pygmaeum]SDG96659.1 ANTAR domain-containing protein [Microbacterium pygmaeum]